MSDARYPSLHETLKSRAAHRRAEALPRARAAIDALRGQGVDISLIGSLTGSDPTKPFLEHSDADFLVRGSHGGVERARIERVVHDVFRDCDVSVDVVYEEDISPERRGMFG